MNDLLGDLGVTACALDDGDVQLDEIGEILDDEPQKQYTVTPKESTFVDTFYDEVGNIKDNLDEIEENTEDLHSKYAESFSEVTIINETAKRNREALKILRKRTSSLLAETRESLKSIDKTNKEMEANDQLRGGAEHRMRVNLHQSLLKRFSCSVNRFHEVELEYKNRKRRDIKRKLEIVSEGEDVTESMVDKFVKNPQQIFIERLKGSSVWHTVRTEYDIAVETRDDLLELETNMNELVEMLSDMYSLVNMQQDLIDSVQRNVQGAIEYVSKGTKDLHQARENTKKSKCCCICAILIVVFVVIGIGLGLAALFGGLGGGGVLGKVNNAR